MIGLAPCSIIFRAGQDYSESANGLPISPQSSGLSSSRTEVSRTWIPPRHGTLKANCDVVLQPGTSKASIAVLIRDCYGSVVNGAVRMKAVGVSHARRSHGDSMGMSFSSFP
ncbi:hypothetical protein HYC85_020497 [Camellia sinensis]|uniref:Uncharacterized protein n=1 Tax=Camellia sinensis TaxID=4442 RepID=A0A7J7GRM6_CAMSI|nr:hypothetical protein HYC85_020497 [Camellia sinensis]